MHIDVQQRSIVCRCVCMCVCQPPASIVIVASPSKPGVGVGEAFGLLVCFTLPLFVCVFVCVLVQASVSLHFLLAIVCMEKYALSPSIPSLTP